MTLVLAGRWRPSLRIRDTSLWRLRLERLQPPCDLRRAEEVKVASGERDGVRKAQRKRETALIPKFL